MSGVSIRTEVLMGTHVTIEVLQPYADDALERAFGWFRHVESVCTRFDEHSELSQLAGRVGIATPASDLLFHAVHFALRVAEETGGAFDPTVGAQMWQRGFTHEHRTGRIVQPIEAAADATYRDVELNAEEKAITVRRPLMLDLGAVAKGLALDLAARELQPLRNFAIDAGGDLYLGGHNSEGEPWSVAIRHPRADGGVIDAVRVSDRAVCTSGDYERVALQRDEHHIIDPRTQQSPRAVASVTVVAQSAMLADALATAAFVLGPDEGLHLLERMGVDGLIVTRELGFLRTPGFVSDYTSSSTSASEQ